jgi:hypothetical protein
MDISSNLTEEISNMTFPNAATRENTRHMDRSNRNRYCLASRRVGFQLLPWRFSVSLRNSGVDSEASRVVLAPLLLRREEVSDELPFARLQNVLIRCFHGGTAPGVEGMFSNQFQRAGLNTPDRI